MNKNIIKAVQQLEKLRLHQPVRLTEDGRTYEMYVSREIHRCDGQYGSYESSRVTVTFGPGRYSTGITAERLAAGTQVLEILGTVPEHSYYGAG